jgi:hypothetical protein
MGKYFKVETRKWTLPLYVGLVFLTHVIEVDGAICDDAAVCEKQLLHKLLVVSLYNVLVVIKLLVA